MKNYANIRDAIKTGFFRGVGLGIGLLTTGLFAAAAAMNVFSPGQVISSSELNQNFTMAAPEGAVVAFNLTDCPDGWAAADGTNGTPDLRGRFVRGRNDFGTGAGTTNVDPTGLRALGSLQLDAFQGHWHDIRRENQDDHIVDFTGTYSGTGVSASFTGRDRALAKEAINDGANGPPRTTTETRPVNIALIYCERMN